MIITPTTPARPDRFRARLYTESPFEDPAGPLHYSDRCLGSMQGVAGYTADTFGQVNF